MQKDQSSITDTDKAYQHLYPFEVGIIVSVSAKGYGHWMGGVGSKSSSVEWKLSLLQ